MLVALMVLIPIAVCIWIVQSALNKKHKWKPHNPINYHHMVLMERKGVRKQVPQAEVHIMYKYGYRVVR